MTSAAYRAVAFFVTVVAAAQTPSGSSTISGRVLNSLTKAPLQKASVMLELDKPPSNALALTDAQGVFTFQNLPAGDYRLHASREGFMGLAFGTTRQGQAGTYVTVGANETRSDLVFRLPPVGAISGVVRDSDGEPIPYVQMMLLRTMYRRGKPELQPFGGGMNAASNDRGEYRIYNILPGKYYLKAQPQEHRGMQMWMGRHMQEQNEPIIGPVFYPNASDTSQAMPLEIRGGEEFEGIDFRLTASPPGALILRAIVPEGIEAQHINVGLSSGAAFNPMGHRSFGYQRQTPDPGVQIRQIVPGEYTVSASINSPGTAYFGSRIVTVQPGGEEKISIELRPAFDVPCAVKVEGPGAEKFRQFRLSLTPPSQRYSSPVPAPQTEWKQGAPCKFTNVLPGIWDIGINPLPPDMYIKSMTLGDQDVLNEEMMLEAQPSSPLTIVVSSAAASLEGEVALSEDGKVQPSVVLLAPEGRYQHVLSLYRLAYTDAKGKVQMKGLTPGSYRVYAFSHVEPTSWQDPEFFKPYAEAGVPVKLVEGQKATVKLQRIDAAAATGDTR